MPSSSSTGETGHELRLRRIFMEAYGRLYYEGHDEDAHLMAVIFGDLLEYEACFLTELFRKDAKFKAEIKAKVRRCKGCDNVCLAGYELGDASTFLMSMGRGQEAERLKDFALKADQWARDLARK